MGFIKLVFGYPEVRMEQSYIVLYHELICGDCVVVQQRVVLLRIYIRHKSPVYERYDWE